jgi:arginine:agmatine antiporter
MVGSSFLMAPAALARYGALSIVVWLISALGALCLGLVFSRLARIAPATGGPYAWSRMGYGDFAGFLIAFGYWISIWTSLPAIAAAFVGYLQALVPPLASPAFTIAIALAAIWSVTLVNVRGIRAAAAFQIATTVAKFLPFLAISLFGLLRISGRHFVSLNPSGEPLLGAIAAAAPITMFAFMGLESATIPAGDVRHPTRTIPRATVLGILLSSVLYILGTVVVLGVVPAERLGVTNAPFADAAGLLWGGWAYDMVAVAAIVSTLGTLNGWTLLPGRFRWRPPGTGSCPWPSAASRGAACRVSR